MPTTPPSSSKRILPIIQHILLLCIHSMWTGMNDRQTQGEGETRNPNTPCSDRSSHLNDRRGDRRLKTEYSTDVITRESSIEEATSETTLRLTSSSYIPSTDRLINTLYNTKKNPNELTPELNVYWWENTQSYQKKREVAIGQEVKRKDTEQSKSTPQQNTPFVTKKGSLQIVESMRW